VFDLRYHVASLAAVFLMLVVGILIGVGISGRGFVDDAERDRLNGRIADLQDQIDAANASSEDLQRRQNAAADFVAGAYPVLAKDRLDGKRIGKLTHLPSLGARYGVHRGRNRRRNSVAPQRSVSSGRPRRGRWMSAFQAQIEDA